MSNAAWYPPNFEARSTNFELTKVDTAVSFKNARKPEVEATNLEFHITEDWWRLLSDGAAIHVLPELIRCYESTKFSEVRQFLMTKIEGWFDPLSPLCCRTRRWRGMLYHGR